MSKPRSQSPPTTVSVVVNRRLSHAYPKSTKDFLLLKKIGLSLRLIEVNYLPLLQDALVKQNCALVQSDFDDIELEALAALARAWPGDFERVHRDRFVLSCPKDKKHRELAKQVRIDLAKFYSSHGLKISYALKVGYSQVKIIFDTLVSSTFVRRENT